MKNALERFLKLKKQYILKIILLFFMLGYFLHFYPPDSPKNRNLKRMKKTLEVSLFYTSVPKIMIICYTVPEVWHMMDVTVAFYFGLFFSLLLP